MEISSGGEDKSCNGCGCGRIKEYRFRLKDSELFQCQNCGLVFSNFDKDIDEDYYDKNEFYDKEGRRLKFFFEKLRSLLRYSRINTINSICKNTGKIIDIGFVDDHILDKLKSSGWETMGTQLSRNAIAKARQRGLNVYFGELKAAGIASESIDLITFWHVLEHIKDPGGCLKETNRLLKDNGHLIIEVPNVSSPIAQIFKAKWVGFFAQSRHLYYFSPRSLNFIHEKNGFSVIRKDFFNFEQSVFTLLQSFLNLLNPKDNLLFRSFIHSEEGKDFTFLLWYNYLLAAIFILPSLVISLLLGLLQCGDVMRFSCVKSADVRLGDS